MTQVKYGFSKMLFVAALAVLNACNPAKPSPDFSLAFSPATLNMNAGETKSSTLTITPIGGFDVNAPVTVAVEGTIFGAGDNKIQAAEPVKVNDTSATIAFSTGISMPAGSYDIALKITSGTLTHSAKITIKVTAAATIANPTNFVATSSPDGTSIDVSWDVVPGATGYLLEVKNNTGVFVALGTTTNTSAAIPGSEPATTYVLRLKALKGAISSSGVEKSVTTN